MFNVIFRVTKYLAWNYVRIYSPDLKVEVGWNDKQQRQFKKLKVALANTLNQIADSACQAEVGKARSAVMGSELLSAPLYSFKVPFIVEHGLNTLFRSVAYSWQIILK